MYFTFWLSQNNKTTILGKLSILSKILTTIYISLSERSSSNDLETGNKFWRTLSVYDNVLVSISAYGFSKKNSNHLSYLELKDKLNSVVNSIKIKKIKKNTSV